MACRFCSLGDNIFPKALADGSNPSFSLAIGLVMVSGSHVEINLNVNYKLFPKVGGEPGVSIKDDRSGETRDREDSFNENVGSFNAGYVL